MRTRVAALVACLAATLAAGDGGAASAKDAPFKRAPDFEKRVEAAIARGAAWLRADLGRERRPEEDDIGAFGAGPSLTYVALRTCGVPADDPAAASVFEAVRTRWLGRTAAGNDGKIRSIDTFELGLTAMAVARHGGPSPVWEAAGDRAVRLSDEDRAWMTEIVRSLEETQDARGGWFHFLDRRGRDPKPEINAAQYAVLGLEAAARAGVRADRATWLSALTSFLDSQCPKGRTSSRAWRRHAARPSGEAAWVGDPWATAGAVAGVALCRGELLGAPRLTKTLDERASAAIADGLLSLGEQFDSTFDAPAADARPPARLLFDTTWAFELAGGAAAVDHMFDHEWYGEGAEHLMATQSPRGAWMDGEAGPDERPRSTSSRLDAAACTSFALLFLARRTPPAPKSPPDDSGIQFVAADKLPDRDFADFLELVQSRWRRNADAGFRGRLLAKATIVGPRMLAPLIEKLSTERDEDRASAFALLKRATGLDHGYDAAATPDARAKALAAWTAWLAANEKTLHYDAAKGLIVP